MLTVTVVRSSVSSKFGIMTNRQRPVLTGPDRFLHLKLYQNILLFTSFPTALKAYFLFKKRESYSQLKGM